ncbi:DUF222 domain-containing protein [Cellulosimicrobium sp. PMB13]|uniref:HNH endonuclease signature motif containing protein n=1 Tax=Cellulosimicrobium sp. PMB13 TaxID=3120158 RepID=UPI003F4B4819
MPDDARPRHRAAHPRAGSLEALADAVADVATVQRQIDALTGARTVAIERARMAALAAHDALLADESARVDGATPQRRVELAWRAAVAELACALRLREGVVEGLVDDAATLTHAVPSVLAGLCAGEFSVAHASALARAVADLDPQAATEVAHACLGRAASTTPQAFRRLVRQARDAVHPEPLALRHERAEAKRAVWVDPAEDGMAWLSALLPAVSAHAIHDRLTSTAADARREGDVRTVAQLRADVLVDLALDCSGSGGCTPAHHSACGHGGAADQRDACGAGGAAVVPSLADLARTIVPRVHVTVPVLTLLGGDAPGHLDGHGPIDADTTRCLTANAPSLRRILTHPETGAVLSVGRDSYTVPADLRAWLTVRDQTCRFPGCTVPAARCDVDHGVDFALGGRTDADNPRPPLPQAPRAQARDCVEARAPDRRRPELDVTHGRGLPLRTSDAHRTGPRPAPTRAAARPRLPLHAFALVAVLRRVIGFHLRATLAARERAVRARPSPATTRNKPSPTPSTTTGDASASEVTP